MGCFENLASCLFAVFYFPCKDISGILDDIREVQYHLIAICLLMANSMYGYVEAFCGKLYFC